MRWWRSIGKPADSAREQVLSFPSPGAGLVDLNRKTAPSERKIRSYVSGDCRKSSDPNSVPIKSTGPVPGEGERGVSVQKDKLLHVHQHVCEIRPHARIRSRVGGRRLPQERLR